MKNGGYIKLNRSDEAEKMALQYPKEFALLTIIAVRARRKRNRIGIQLELGEALIGIGDVAIHGWTERAYRTAKHRLATWQIATFKATSKGTIATLTDTSIYDINMLPSDEQSDEQVTSDRRASDEQVTTNEEGKKERRKEGKKTERARSPVFSTPTRGEVQEYATSISFQSLDPDAFIDYYEARGWALPSGQKVKCWKACVRTWKHRDRVRKTENPVRIDMYTRKLQEFSPTRQNPQGVDSI